MLEFTAFDINDFRDRMQEAVESARGQIGCFNLVVVGKTGVGKSTLINAVFGYKATLTGLGRPVTRDTEYFKHPDLPLGIYDSQGFETGESGDALVGKLDKIVSDTRSQPLAEHIHAVWYCVRWSDRRFEDKQAELITRLTELGLPVIGVMTQVPLLEDGSPHPEAIEFAQDIESRELRLSPAKAMIFTNSKADVHLKQQVHGLQELLDATFQVVPEGAQNALTAAQAIDEERKRANAQDVIKAAVAAAGAAAVVPIPLADSALIVPIQVLMMGRIATAYGVALPTGSLVSLATSAFFAQGAAAVGKAVVRGLLSLIPGLGFLQAPIKAGVASALTYGVGQAWLEVCEYLYTQDPELMPTLGPEVQRLFITAFKQQAKHGVAKFDAAET